MSLNKFYVSGLVKKVQLGDIAEAALKKAQESGTADNGVSITYQDKTKVVKKEEAMQMVTDAGNSFAELFMLTEDGQISLARHYLRDDSLAHEAITDVYTRARKGIDQLHETAVFEPWVRGFTFWKCYNLQRIRKSAQENADNALNKVVGGIDSLKGNGAEGLNAASDAPVDQEAQIVSAFETMDLHEPLGMLEIPEKEALLLRYSAKMMPSQVASEMGVSETKGNKYLEDGRQNLLKILNAPAEGTDAKGGAHHE